MPSVTILARQDRAIPVSICDGVPKSFLNKFVVNKATSVLSLKHNEAAKYPGRRTTKRGCDITSQIEKPAHWGSYPIVVKYDNFTTAQLFTCIFLDVNSWRISLRQL